MHPLLHGQTDKKILMMGNEAISRGALMPCVGQSKR
jgi:hypothetical protein